MLYRPENVLFLGIGVYLAIFLLSPLEVRVSIEIGSFVYIALTIVALTSGSRFADHFRLGCGARILPKARLQRMENRLFWTTLWLGGVGNMLKLVDKYVLRGVGSLSGLEARDMLLEAGSSPLSAIAGLLYPFGYLPIFILLGAKVLPRKKWKLTIAGLVFLIPALDALVFFSRIFLMCSFAMVYFGTSLIFFRGRAIPLPLLLLGLASSGLLITVSSIIFIWRLDQVDLGVLDSVFLSGYAFTVQPNATAQELISWSSLFAIVLPLVQYFVHPIFEFQILWSFNQTQEFSYGALLFSPYVKFLSILGITSEIDYGVLFPRVGVFTSFWGPLWVDFGWIGPLMLFFFGFIARMVARAARIGQLHAYPLYTYFCIILFFMPMINFAISAQGMYVINAFVFFWFMARKTARAIPN